MTDMTSLLADREPSAAIDKLTEKYLEAFDKQASRLTNKDVLAIVDEAFDKIATAAIEMEHKLTLLATPAGGKPQ